MKKIIKELRFLAPGAGHLVHMPAHIKYQSLIKQGRNDEATMVEKRFKDAWKYSDIELKSSRIR